MIRAVSCVLLALGIGAGAFWFVTQPATVPERALGEHVPDRENGRSIFYAGGCSSCHATPEQDDRTRLGGGLALRTQFGTFYVPNISSHPEDGIGSWTEAQFVTAMTRGTSPDGRHYYPSFPYTSYQRMSIGDLRDLFAYLKTLPAFEGRIRAHDLSFPVSLRRGLGLWKRLFLDGRPFAADAGQPADWNRGAYLVNGPGHCAECHSPRNVFGAVIAAQRFAGGPNPAGEGWVPNITQKGLKNWSRQDIEILLETGDTPGGDAVGGQMTAVVRNTAQLSAADRAAIAVYLKSLPPVDGPSPPGKR